MSRAFRQAPPRGRRPRARSLLAAGLLLAAAQAADAAQGREERVRREYEKRAREVLLDAGERHLDFGIDLRDQGLVAAAASEFLAAVELSDGQHPGAKLVLSYMRRFDDRFWTRRVVPTPARLDRYEKRAAKLRREDREDRFELAEWAWRRDLRTEARTHFEALLGGSDEPLERDDSGRLVLDVGKLPEELSEELVAGAVTINGLLYLRDAFLERVPELAEVHERRSERLLVRTQTSAEDAEWLHSLGSALLPQLETELGGRPTRRLHLFLFADRADYEAYLERADLAAWKVVSGMADLATGTTILCAEGKQRDAIAGLALHELTHLAEHAVSPVRMPAWYREGLADAFGGQGTFAWDGTELVLGMTMDRRRLEPLLDPARRWSFAELGRVDPLALWSVDAEAASRFYAQSWALVRFLRHEAPDDVRERFDEWLAMCRGTAVGVGAEGATSWSASPSAAPAQELFDRIFAEDLPELEAAFVRWLEAQ